MFSSQPTSLTSSPSLQASSSQPAFQRVSVNIPGRLMLASHEEFACTITEMSPGDARISCVGRPATGERVVAYLEHIGRLEGIVLNFSPRGFVISLNATDRKREKLAAQLTWIANKHELGLPEDRRHDRLAPRATQSEIAFEDGRRYACRIMDLSLSGAAIDIGIKPQLGTQLRLGNMRGRVIRHFREGVAIEFSSVQSRESLSEFL